MLDILLNYIQQVISTIGIIFAFGLLFAFCRRMFCKLLGNVGVFIINYVTGWIGTPIHELSHAFFHVIFGHKVVKIDLYSPNDGDDSLGYVSYLYNERSLYQKVGLFFSGIGPLIGGSAVIMLLMMILAPELHNNLSNDLHTIINTSTYVEGYYEMFLTTITEIFNPEYMNSLWYWIFLILSIMIASHMELSLPDIKSAGKGLAVLLIALLVVDIVLYIADPSIVLSMTAATSYFGLGLGGILIIGAVFNLLLLIIALIIRVIRRH